MHDPPLEDEHRGRRKGRMGTVAAPLTIFVVSVVVVVRARARRRDGTCPSRHCIIRDDVRGHAEPREKRSTDGRGDAGPRGIQVWKRFTPAVKRRCQLKLERLVRVLFGSHRHVGVRAGYTNGT